METATFAAGCFWGIELAFMQVQGVTKTSVGYMGGDDSKSTYNDVCSGTTNHAEVMQIEFDPEVVTYSQLLELFWANHDPTTLNRQGPDVGTQYRSAIFYHSPVQREIADASKEKASRQWSNPIITEVTPVSVYHLAEDYHQQYLAKRNMASCSTR